MKQLISLLNTLLFLWLTPFMISAQVDFQPSELEDIICKEQHHAHTLITGRTVQNSYAHETDIYYQEMHWEIDPAQRYISGQITYHFKSNIPDLTRFVLDLSNNLQVVEITTHNHILTFDHTPDQLLFIHLDTFVAAGESYTLTIQYEGVPPSNGFGSFEQGEHDGAPIVWTLSEPYGVRDWWPAKQDLIDKIDSTDIFITTPLNQLAASNGKLISITEQNGNLVHHWRHRYPIASYLVALAVTNYSAYSHFLPLDNGDTIEILNYVYPETLTQSMNSTVSSLDIMTLYNELFGTYPFASEKYGHAQFGWGGGMEHQTMSFMGGFSFGLQAHEMAHQWFGDKVTCGSWREIWLNEGFATYLTGLTYERFSPEQFWPQWKTSTSNSAMSQPGGSVYVDDTTSVNRIFSGRLTYNKGAYLLHMLRWITGDEAFFEACRVYLNAPGIAYDFGTTDELQSILENQSGKNLGSFFDDWFYGEGFPSYDLKWSQQADSVIMWLSQTTSHPSVSFFEMPVPVELTLNGTPTIFTLEHSSQNQRFSFYTGNANIDAVSIDPGLWLLSKNNIVTQITTSLDDPIASNQLTVFPNPADRFVDLLPYQPSGKAVLTNLLGQSVYANIQHGRIALEGTPAGLYVLRILDENANTMKSATLVIQHQD
jgi:aminopeptidase N